MPEKISYHINEVYKSFVLRKGKVCLYVMVPVFLAMHAAAQNPLQQQFDTYRQNVLQEKVYLHSDKDFYLAGEVCWFKIYNVDAFFNRPLGLSKVAYVELLDKNDKPILQAKIALKEGDGNGSLQLPVSINSGNYKLRAYTNWMKNFSTDYFFDKIVTIINPRKIYEGDTIQPKSMYNIKFFPEGGNLVNGIQSKIAFRVTDQYGKGIQCDGVIIGDNTDTIVKYTTRQFGIGNFLFTPQGGHTYKAVIALPGFKKTTEELPVAYNSGYVMHLDAAANQSIKITVESPVNNSTASTVYLFAHTRGSVKASLTGTMENGRTEFLIDKSKLGDGISHFTVFNIDRQPVCERLYFKYPTQRLALGLTANAQEYDLRKRINIQVNAADQDGKPMQADMSMAVYRIDSLQGIDGMDINNYLWLSSDLAGRVENPGYYFNNNAPGIEEAMDNLMLTHGWRRFRWEDVLKNRKPAFEFVPEFVGHVVKGKVIKTGVGSPVKDISGFLSVPGTRTQFRSAISDSNGLIKFDIKDFYNEGEIIVQSNSQQDSLCSVEIFNPFIEKYSAGIFPAFSMAQVNAGALINHHIGIQVQNVYNGNKVKQFRFPAIDTSTFYFKPDVSYLLDNYVRFTTMEEVLREYVAPVNVRRRGGKFHLPVFDELRRQFFDIDPLLLLDGVPVFDIDKFMNYDPLKVRKLDVVSRMYFLGNMFFNGIVNFVTYKGNLEGYELDPHATVLDYEGLQLQREFFSPLYETSQQAESHLPDFRNLLYWSPQVKTNKEGKQDISFYSSDIPGKYVVVLQGLTADGKAGTKLIQFDVKEPASITNK